jgi:phosphatidylserine/phosphatidylglycerophosphate/cardiolipin synthase-like enzyme
MGLLRHRLVRRVREADRHGRFRLLYPRVPGDGVRLNVHSKLLIVDDAIARIGSANLSNRSMGLDTECDAHVEAGGDAAIERGIARLRARLLGEHLGATPERVEETLAETGSLLATVDRLAGGERTLAPLEVDLPGWVDAVVPESLLTDPEQPLKSLSFIDDWTPALLRDPHRRTVGPILAGVGLAGLVTWAARTRHPARFAFVLASGVLGVVGLRRLLFAPRAVEPPCTDRDPS